MNSGGSLECMGFLPVECKEDKSYRKRYLRAKGERHKLKMRLRKESSHFAFNRKRKKMEKQSKKFPEDNTDQARERDSQCRSETERTEDCRVRGHERDEVQARVSKLQEQEEQLPREAFWQNWYHQHDSNTLKKHAVERRRERQGKRSLMILIDLNEEPPQTLFEEGSSIAALHEDPRQLLFGKGTSIAALRARMDCRELADRDLGKRFCQPQQQPHEARTLLFQPGSRVLALRSGVDFIQPEKPAARDHEKVSREIGLNLHREEERPEVITEKVEAIKHREEVVDRGVYKENLDVGLDVLCSLAMNEIQRIEKASRPSEEVEVMRHREEDADLYGTREEKLNEMAETDRRIYKEDLNVFYKGSGTPPAKRNCEDLGLITLEASASEDVDFLHKDSAIPFPKRNWEDPGSADMEQWRSFTRSMMEKAVALYNNKPSPVQIAATVSVCNLPNLDIFMQLLKQLLELVANQCWT